MRDSSKRIEVRLDDLTGPEIRDLIREHLSAMHALSPAKSVHALDVEKLRDPSIRFYSAWIEGALAGCGALKAIGPLDGEVKSMRTRDAFRRLGIASALLDAILDEARSRRYQRLCLETGGTADFAAAHRLYESYGFKPCGPFGDYRPDPFSRFMTLELDAT